MTTTEITSFINDKAPNFISHFRFRPNTVFVHSSEVPRSCPSSINCCRVVEDYDERFTSIDKPLKLGYVVHD